MGLSYTRNEIRTKIAQDIRDSNHGTHSKAVKNRIIRDVHRDWVERTECNRNVLVFSLADATSDGVIEYDKNGNTPTITRVDVEGRNYYVISNCDLIDKISRWDDDDYQFKELGPMVQHEIDEFGVLQTTTEKPCGYQLLDSPDTFQLLPALDTDGYTYKFEVRYREAVRDLITYDGSPTDSTVIQTTGAGLSDFTVSVGNASMPAKYKIVIATAAVPDTVNTFKDIYDGNGYVAVGTGIALTGAAQAIADNVTFTAEATTGHTAADVFEFAVDDLLTPSCPNRFCKPMWGGMIAALLRRERDEAWRDYQTIYERDVQRIKRKARRLHSDQAPTIRSNYVGSGN